jgi:hypothetical protein
MAPTLMRLPGAFLPNTEAGTIEGNPSAAEAMAEECKNFLLDIYDLFFCIGKYFIVS